MKNKKLIFDKTLNIEREMTSFEEIEFQKEEIKKAFKKTYIYKFMIFFLNWLNKKLTKK